MALDYGLLKLVKQAFIPGDPNMAGGDPAAGGAPMDPSMMGGDPSMGGMPPMDPSMMGGDPSMGGMPPMDPSMMGGDPSMGGMPPAGGAPMPVDPMSMMGMAPPPPADAGSGSAPNGDAMITMSVDQFLKFLKQMMALAGKSEAAPVQQAAQPSSQDGDRMAQLEAKVDALVSMLG